MDDRHILDRFEGRIGRGRYWLATLIILGAMISALLLLAAICLALGIPSGSLTVNLIGISASFQLDDDDVAAKAGLFPHVANLLLTLVFAWFYAAVSIRRLHDRNKSGWWLIPFIVATGLYSEFGGRIGGSWAAVAVGIAVYIGFIWGLVEMGFLKGTNGPNRFGPDPLAPRDTGPSWDQGS
ncbi:MAG: DUF805 domain-containing protein, partial [Xanthobacteraceae bacterium]